MAIAFLEGQVADTIITPAVTPAFTNAFALGQIVVVGCNMDAALTGLVTSVSDSKGNTYARVPSFDIAGGGGTLALDCWWAIVTNTGAAPTVTVNFDDSSTNMNIVVQVFSGFVGTATFDKKSTSDNASSTTCTSGATGVTSQNVELVVGLGVHNLATSAFSLGAGFTTLTQSSVADRQGAMQSLVTASAGAQTSNMTIAAARVNIGGVATFYDAVAGGASRLALLGVG
jgi:hypothetical protein